MKTLALYLPQFHRVPENDEWWGEGFTEWTAVKGAEKLFEGHNQPRVPLNNNYYNLLDHDTMAWQADLMKEYRVDGMCIYHYWFENGRRILEKPAENLLEWNDIQMPFCFDWANRTWIKTWKKLTDTDTTAWSSIYESHSDCENKGILLQQRYGREKDWEEHFEYLLPFFKDERYIKLNEKPVFMIDVPGDILCLSEMVNYFNSKARENGFQGIYFIGARKCELDGLDAVFEIQPDHRTASYDQMWKMTINQSVEKNKKVYFCASVDFDNSPRMGKDAFIMNGASPQKFYKYYKKLYKKSQLLNNEFIFVNAWNEWGEGMYLEPDEKYKFSYLNAINQVVVECENTPVMCDENDLVVEFCEEPIWKKGMRNLVRHDKLLHNWICLKEKNIDFAKFFKRYRYHKIAIYGMGKLGIHLMNELQGSDITVVYGIDKNEKGYKCGVEIYNLNHNMPIVDAIVITITNQYSEISKILCEKIICPMVTIEEIIQELLIEYDRHEV